jgi:hypothetical protein
MRAVKVRILLCQPILNDVRSGDKAVGPSGLYRLPGDVEFHERVSTNRRVAPGFGLVHWLEAYDSGRSARKAEPCSRRLARAAMINLGPL